MGKQPLATAPSEFDIAIMKERDDYRSTLEEIANPIAAIQARAKRDGLQVDGHMAVVIADDPYYLKGLAKKTLEAYALSRPPREAPHG